MESDEIDLVDLFNAFKKTWLFKVLNNSFNFILKNKILLLIFLLVGGVGGYFYEKKQIPVYRSEMVIFSKELDNFTCNQMVSSIDSLLINQNTKELEKFGFTKDLTSEIKKIEFIYPQFGKEELLKTEPFRIAVYSSNNKKFELIEKSILGFLLDNPYSKKNQERKLSILKSEASELNSELTIIDSTYQILIQYLNSRVIDESKQINVADLIKESKNAKQRLSEIEIEIENIDNFIVLNSFTPTDTPLVIKKYYALKFSLLAFFLGFILLRLFKK